MESLQVRTGQISLQILDDNGDPRGVFKFVPTDIESAKQMMKLQEELHDKIDDFDKRVEEAQSADAKVEILSEVVDYFETQIDNIFGAGSSKILFGDAKTLSMFQDFFEGITPYYQKASKQRVAKYKKK